MSAALPHILIVDDDRRIRELLQSFLRDHHYLTSLAASASDARAMMQGLSFDLLIVDVMMPGETGTDFVAALRRKGGQVPVLMLSALTEPPERIAGLAAGSDDYLGKPFETEELLLRMKSLLRRSLPVAETPRDIVFGEFSFDAASGLLHQKDMLVKLTSRERDILRILASRPGDTFSRLDLAQSGSDDATRSVDVQVNRLRQKIEADPANPRFLQTVRGQGYALMPVRG